MRSLILGDETLLKKRLEIRIDGRQIHALHMFYCLIRNNGNTPILPQDFVEPITVSVDNPWLILSISQSKFGSKMVLQWEKINNRSYKLKSSLFNPGDSTFLRYMLALLFKIAFEKNRPVL